MSKITTYAQSYEAYREKECPVCLDEFSRNTIIHELGCKHIFHPECIDKLEKKICPKCRQEIDPISIRKEFSKGFYWHLLLYLSERWPRATGNWEEDDFQAFALELSHALVTHSEWNYFIPHETFFDLVRIFNSDYKNESDDLPDIVWQEALYAEFTRHPAIRPLFIMLAQRYIDFCQNKDKNVTLFTRMKNLWQTSTEEKENLIKAYDFVDTNKEELPWRGQGMIYPVAAQYD
jgi:hypothetical protein